METIKILKVKQSVLANNDTRANELRNELRKKNIFLINVMSSPGSGKTTLLVNLINRLKQHLRIGVMEADMDAKVDAETVSSKTGVKTIQLNTTGECHLDAKMTSEGVAGLGEDEFDLIFLENIGNLVCPAEFDTGATLNLVILSVPEGDDKPIKYPLMFTVGDAFVFTKIDALSLFDFDFKKAEESILKVNKEAKFFPVSAKTDEGMEKLASYILEVVTSYKNQ
ncbi:MAG: hydrogenase nickel incorporation protein HypB [Bacillales bacterium]|nr:hydrogenase nickel incorporation protein HypB [Mollicutes bacterium]MCI7212621.1 hydrogenase nickel incorporation protein HypB [Bacillales bacterium]MDD7715086.1 hydrogenase nickel incorporation protein HypB [Mollicutes bacterium]MDY3903889.1 hydrogenase nickel incorporation protein HypB [Candidatus Enteromonas sp.]MDY4936144.1 hydrogenase nickel incorporation protein HypB [Candidatus Enteromonas sp.]